MRDFRAFISTMARELADESNAATDLWTWLPSYADAVKKHGDYSHNYMPALADILHEATIVMAHFKHGGKLENIRESMPAETLEGWFDCAGDD